MRLACCFLIKWVFLPHCSDYYLQNRNDSSCEDIEKGRLTNGHQTDIYNSERTENPSSHCTVFLLHKMLYVIKYEAVMFWIIKDVFGQPTEKNLTPPKAIFLFVYSSWKCRLPWNLLFYSWLSHSNKGKMAFKIIHRQRGRAVTLCSTLK